jgi:2-keto-4-pentenoate hydratase|tara:strand:- start:498 stop:1286 length:789 start_codon:yes stop_codon:yes gene_type:complete
MTDSQQPTWLDAALTKTLAGEPVQNISVNHPDISMDEAYALQHELVGKLRDHGGWGEIYGYKAALTALPAQQAMGITEPIIGVLFERAVFPADGATTIKTDRPVLLETEVGFTLGKPITEPVTEHNVLDAVAYCSGLIELASPNLQQRPTSVDLISNNSASYGCVVGVSNKHPTDIDLDAVPVTLTRLASADEVLHTAAAGSVMAGQVDALIWLINSTLAQGYALRPGHVLMTGSIGSMHAGKAGKYRADFGALGDLAFVLD